MFSRDFSNTNKPVEINAQRLEDLFAKGLTLAEVATELKLGYAFLSRRINASLSLTLARRNGRNRAKARQGVMV